MQFAVNPADRGDPRHRDEPARLALERAGLEGDRLPDRQDRRAAGGRLRARGDPQRHHRHHARQLRADDRLRGRQVAALRLREVPRRRLRPLDAHEVGGRGDGDRAHVPAGLREGAALRELDVAPSFDALDRDALLAALERPAADRYDVMLEAFRQGATVEEVRGRTAIDPWFLRELRELALDPEAPFAGERSFKAVDTCAAEFAARDAVLLLGLGAPRRPRGRARRAPERGHPRRRPQPHRPGHRVRLLLRARGDDRARVRPRRGDGQLQPRDGLDRLRHLRPPLLRAAHARGRPRGHRGRAPRGRDRPVRRPDAAEARRRAAGGRRAAARHERRRDRPRRGPRALRRAARAPRLRGAALRDARTRSRRRWRGPRRVGFPLLVRPCYVLGGRAMEIVYSRDGLADYLRAHARATGARSSSTASWRTRSRSTSTRCATARTSGSAAIMQHVEEAGIHSGDSACVLPPHSLGPRDARARSATPDPRHRAGPRRRRAAQRPVRRPRRARST